MSRSRCAALGLLCASVLAADGCSQKLEVLTYESVKDGSVERDASAPSCDACSGDELCWVGRCVARSEAVALSAGAGHTCMIKAGMLSCWGSNLGSQLGTGDTSQHRVPNQVGDERDWVEVAAGGRHTCGLRAPGALYCWGDNGLSQLGIGGTRTRPSPTRVGEVDDFAALSCKGDNCCALRRDHALYCWGSNADGNVGVDSGTAGPVTTPTLVAADYSFARVSVGATHTCAVREDGALMCWGNNAAGELGLGASRVAQRQPRRVGTATDWSGVACGLQHTCGTHAGALACWGANAFGQVGVGRAGPDAVPLVIDVPTPLGAAKTWQSIAAGGFHSCAHKGRAEFWCWGRGDMGQLGIAGTPVAEMPMRLANAASLRQFVLGTSHSCAFDGDNQLFCWGENAQGQLGVGDTQPRDEPTLVQ